MIERLFFGRDRKRLASQIVNNQSGESNRSRVPFHAIECSVQRLRAGNWFTYGNERMQGAGMKPSLPQRSQNCRRQCATCVQDGPGGLASSAWVTSRNATSGFLDRVIRG